MIIGKFLRRSVAMTGAITAISCLKRECRLDAEVKQQEIPRQLPLEIEDKDDEDHSEWMAEKEKCSFCEQFLLSPCKVPFRKWSKCVDKAKEENLDFVASCFKYTGALIECTTNNEDYFTSMSDDDVEEEEVDDASGDGSASPPSDEKPFVGLDNSENNPMILTNDSTNVHTGDVLDSSNSST